VDAPTARALADAFRAFEEDDEAKVAVLLGEGGIFCAGADLKGMVTDRRNVVDPDMEEDGPMGPTRFLLSKPVIAAVAGHAVAGGLELALWCDLRVVEESAVFGVFCRRWGVPLLDGGTVRLPRLIGLSRALDMILTGRPVGAEEALAWGLANRVVANGTSREEAEKLALEISKFPQTCMRGDRLSAHEQFGLTIDEALENEFFYGTKTVLSGETVEGALRFAGGAGRHGEF
jgi:enoyl-CoA hydratase